MQVNVKTGTRTQSKPQPKIPRDTGQIGVKTGARRSAAKGRSRTAKKTVKAIISGAERHQLISEAAYLRAEQRGFEGDHAIRDWLEAEAQIDSIYRVEG
jgi:hypothetical protein